MNKSQKILFDALGLMSVVGFGYAGWQIFKLLSDKKKAEIKSNFIGSNKKTIVFTLTNNTNQTQTEYLFDSRSGQNNPNVGITPNMDLFNAELSSDPKKVSKIEFRNINSGFSGIDAVPIGDSSDVIVGDVAIVDDVVVTPVSTPVMPPIVDPISPPVGGGTPAAASPQYNQAEAPFKMNCLDASGNSSQQQFIPLISSRQYQKGITTVKMNGTILDGGCFMEYTMFPNSKVSIVVYYEDYPLSDLLIKKKESANGGGIENINNSKMKIPLSKGKHMSKAVGSALIVGVLGFGMYKYLSK